jgi:hypothetical protein
MLARYPLAVGLLFACAALGQQVPDPPSGNPPAPTPGTPTAPASPNSVPPGVLPADSKADTDQATKKPIRGTSKDRLFFALPNFLTLENAGNVPPLTAGAKFKVTAQGSFDPVEYVWYGLVSGIDQAQNSPASYGHGAEGYGKRYLANFADGTIENFATKAIFPSLLREDPRYFQLGEGGFWHRTGYAMSRIFVTRTDAGNERFNFSEILGAATSSAISLTYHPSSQRNLAGGLTIFGTQVGYDTLTLVVKEFWPDIRRKLRKSHSAPTE